MNTPEPEREFDLGVASDAEEEFLAESQR